MGKKFVIYEVWTRHRIVEAEDYDDALSNNDPEPIEGMSLSNWHAVPIDDAEIDPKTGALNYRQV